MLAGADAPEYNKMLCLPKITKKLLNYQIATI